MSFRRSPSHVIFQPPGTRKTGGVRRLVIDREKNRAKRRHGRGTTGGWRTGISVAAIAVLIFGGAYAAAVFFEVHIIFALVLAAFCSIPVLLMAAMIGSLRQRKSRRRRKYEDDYSPVW